MNNGDIAEFMANHHKECDELFAIAEGSVASGDWELGTKQWDDFAAELEKHFSREEDILFPGFEEASGMTCGPTQMMRLEHEQVRALVTEINEAVNNKDEDQFLGLTETLMITMQQHNMKEEQVLYPMINQFLPDPEKVIEGMKES